MCFLAVMTVLMELYKKSVHISYNFMLSILPFTAAATSSIEFLGVGKHVILWMASELICVTVF